MHTFEMEKKRENDTLILVMKGSINETFVVPQVEDKSIRRLILDLEGVDLINSRGIIRWARWLDPVSKIMAVILRRCPKIIVDQMNSIKGFLPPTVQVESFYVPYFCEHCELSSKALFTRDLDFKIVNRKPVLNKPANKCPTCKRTLNIDALEEIYFSFLSH